MRFAIITLSAFTPLLLLFSCKTPPEVSGPNLPSVRSDIILQSDLPYEFDTTRTYVLEKLPENPDSLLTLMVREGIPFVQGWVPFFDDCPMDRLNRSTLTVELAHDDLRIAQYGFRRGVGFLGCSTHLTRYRIVLPLAV